MGKREINVGLTVSRYFKSLGIRQLEVAERLGVKKQTIANHMQLVVFPEPIALKYTEAFGFNFAFLLTGKGSLEKSHASIRAIKRENIELKRIVAEQKKELDKMHQILAQ